MIKFLILFGIFVIGFIFGIAAVNVCENAGNLIIDESDAFDGPYLFLELDRPIDKIIGRTAVLLYIKRRKSR